VFCYISRFIAIAAFWQAHQYFVLEAWRFAGVLMWLDSRC